jgi:hypothetical protein
VNVVRIVSILEPTIDDLPLAAIPELGQFRQLANRLHLYEWMKNLNPAKSVDPDNGTNAGAPNEGSDLQLKTLLNLFYSERSAAGAFTKVAVESLPAVAKNLLAHDHHMTVTLEQHHGCPVDVHVIESKTDDGRYSRKITLTRQSDDAVVMFGLVRMDRTVFSDEVRNEIESQRTPLGRVLIENDVLRSVRLMQLYRIESPQDLADALGIKAGAVCFGRTAMIYCDGAEAIELLEIVPGE